MKRLSQRIILRVAATEFVRRAITERADLAAFKEKPTPATVVGMFAIGLSFLLGWPAIAALGVLAVKWRQPWLVVVGGPVTYGISHLVFLLGMYLSGAVYSLIFCRWLTRITMERCLAWAVVGERREPEQETGRDGRHRHRPVQAALIHAGGLIVPPLTSRIRRAVIVSRSRPFPSDIARS